MLFDTCCCNVEPSDSGTHNLNDEYDHQDQSGHETPPDTLPDTLPWVGAIQNVVGHVVEDIEDRVSQVVEHIAEGVADALHLDEMFKRMADHVLDEVAPKAGEMTIDEAQDFIPAFDRLDKATSRDLHGEATEACTSRILGYRQKIHDFCEDVTDALTDQLSDPTAGILSCLYRVFNWILRACKEGIRTAVDLLKKVIPDCIEPCCFSCLGLEGKLASWVTSTYNKVVDILEGIIQEALRSVGVPDWICDKVDFNGNASADNARDEDEPVKARKARELAVEVAPPQMSLEAGGDLGQV